MQGKQRSGNIVRERGVGEKDCCIVKGCSGNKHLQPCATGEEGMESVYMHQCFLSLYVSLLDLSVSLVDSYLSPLYPTILQSHLLGIAFTASLGGSINGTERLEIRLSLGEVS